VSVGTNTTARRPGAAGAAQRRGAGAAPATGDAAEIFELMMRRRQERLARIEDEILAQAARGIRAEHLVPVVRSAFAPDAGEIAEALARLVTDGRLVRGEDGRLFTEDSGGFRTPVPDESVRPFRSFRTPWSGPWVMLA
jgi:hypothetical protein